MAAKKFMLANGAPTGFPVAEFDTQFRSDQFSAVPEPSAFANPPFLSACMLDGMDTLVVAFGGQDRVGAAFELTKLFQEIDQEATISGFFIAPIAENYMGLFFLVRHTTDPRKLVGFRLELEKRFRDIPRDLPEPQPGKVERFDVVAPDGPGVLHKVTGELRARNLNMKKLSGGTFVRFVGGKPKEFARLKFKVMVPAGKEGEFEAFVAAVEAFGPEWEVRRKSPRTRPAEDLK